MLYFIAAWASICLWPSHFYMSPGQVPERELPGPTGFAHHIVACLFGSRSNEMSCHLWPKDKAVWFPESCSWSSQARTPFPLRGQNSLENNVCSWFPINITLLKFLSSHLFSKIPQAKQTFCVLLYLVSGGEIIRHLLLSWLFLQVGCELQETETLNYSSL